MVDTGNLRYRVSIAVRPVQSPVVSEMKKCVRLLTIRDLPVKSLPDCPSERKAVGWLNPCLFLFWTENDLCVF